MHQYSTIPLHNGDPVHLQDEQFGPRDFRPTELVQDMLRDLSNEREAEVLQRRYGIATQNRETLERIGKDFGVTRERIRQIENAGLKSLRVLKEYENELERVGNYLAAILERYAGALEQEHLLEEALRQKSDEEKKTERYALLFLMEKLLDAILAQKRETHRIKTIWHLKQAELDRLEAYLQKAEEKLREREESPLSFQALHKDVLVDHPYEVSEDLAKAYMRASNMIASNPFDEWGLKSWQSIRPKRMGEKIYLVLKKYGKPLHYQEIANHINKYQFDHKHAHPPTIHNELILDPRYVLVGRGRYALKDWGYKSGIVADLLLDIMKNNPDSLTKKELIEQILAQRNVKPSTIALALNDSRRFIKNTDGTYGLASRGPED